MDVAIIVPVTLFILIGLIVWVFFYYRYRSRRDLQATVRQAIEKGQELSPELMARLGEPENPEHADLRRAVIAITIGVSFAAFGLILGQEDAMRPLMAVGAFPFLVGVAYLGLWRFTHRAN